MKQVLLLLLISCTGFAWKISSEMPRNPNLNALLAKVETDDSVKLYVKTTEGEIIFFDQLERDGGKMRGVIGTEKKAYDRDDLISTVYRQIDKVNKLNFLVQEIRRPLTVKKGMVTVGAENNADNDLEWINIRFAHKEKVFATFIAGRREYANMLYTMLTAKEDGSFEGEVLKVYWPKKLRPILLEEFGDVEGVEETISNSGDWDIVPDLSELYFKEYYKEL